MADESALTDPLRQALVEATLAVLCGSTEVAQQYVDPQGNTTLSTITLQSAFVARIQQQAYRGDFDPLIAKAIEQVSPASIARAIEGMIATHVMAGLGRRDTYGGRSEPNWLQDKAKSIAVEACTAALVADDELLDNLRSRIGAEVDRNRVGITVNLSDPEAKS